MIAIVVRGGFLLWLLLLGFPAVAQGFGSAPLAEAALGRIAGREDVSSVAQAQQAAAVTHNTISGQVTTGSIQVSDKAFQNMSGLAVVNTNTGNNVAINAAMNVTITMTPR